MTPPAPQDCFRKPTFDLQTLCPATTPEKSRRAGISFLSARGVHWYTGIRSLIAFGCRVRLPAQYRRKRHRSKLRFRWRNHNQLPLEAGLFDAVDARHDSAGNRSITRRRGPGGYSRPPCSHFRSFCGPHRGGLNVGCFFLEVGPLSLVQRRLAFRRCFAHGARLR